MHPTPLREPSHTTACAPDEELDLAGEPSLALLEQTLGCAVYLEVEDEFDIVVTVKDGVMNRETNTFEINFMRSLSAVSGYGLRLWVVSPNFVTKPEVEDEFPDRSAYSGVLVRSDEVRASSQRLDRMVAELAKTLQEESGWELPEDSYLLLADWGGRVRAYEFGYVPIAGSDDTLFVRVRPGAALDVPPLLFGILERADRDTTRNLARALGRELPDRVGLLTLGTPADYPRSGRNPPAFSFAFGAVLMTLGGAWTWASRRSRKPAVERTTP